MRLPRPAPATYLETVLIFVGLLAGVQYTGLFFGSGGSLDIPYLVGSALVFLVAAYLLSVVAANTPLLSEWERLSRDSGE
ncbi:hypothetical protein [Natronomonas pharaonis]|uniref:hypothetical protein n=1 Tax=Natronomonas pharaonis TaxID=2257 RepID=UPI0006782980|nr:hypothetical protein [Natronomonas pharaonis]